MRFNEIPKFVVNLERRPDRLEKVKKEMDYIGWDYEIFKAIDTNSYMGITRSILEIIKIAKEQKYPRVMVIEDDIGFMPYSKDFLEKLENKCNGLTFGVFNLSPTFNRSNPWRFLPKIRIKKNYIYKFNSRKRYLQRIQF